jgi:5'(3')-deoxyribonucleotidase
MNTKIAIDVDEVLVHLLKPMSKWKGVKLPKQPKYRYLYREIFNCTEEQSQKILHEFYLSEDFLNLKPIRGSQYAMKNLSSVYDKMYIVTGRQEVVRETTELWIDKFFPGIFDDIILTNSFTENEIKKVDVCRALAIGCIIDDSMGTCNECIGSGMQALNFIGEQTYPWCEETNISIPGWEKSLKSKIYIY